MGRYLVVAHQTAESPELKERLLEVGAQDPDAEFVVLIPATPSGSLLVWEEGEAKDIAQRQGEGAQKAFADAGLRVLGWRIGDQNPLLALSDELREHAGYEAVVISTFPAGASRWLKMDLISRAERQFPHLKFIHVISEAKTQVG